MNGKEILMEITNLGASVALSEDGERIRVTDTKGVITEELKEYLMECKPQLLALLKEQSRKLEDIMVLSAGEFKSRNIAIRIHSDVLEEDFWLVSNEETREHLKADGLVCYLAEEIPNLRGLSKERLRYINEVKKIFERSRVVGPKNL